MDENSCRYFTPQEVETIIKDEKQNQFDVWISYLSLNEIEQNNILKDTKILEKLTNKINNTRTIKLLKAYKFLKNQGELIEYIVDLDEAFIKLFGEPIEALQETFFNKKERAGWMLIRTHLYEKTQEELEFDLSITEYKISQRRISKMLTDTR